MWAGVAERRRDKVGKTGDEKGRVGKEMDHRFWNMEMLL